ncbi:stealth family protein [Desulfonatronovibrio magnus]|uniref:stealth family protein n=1 Tax=Desulfonatronovibrio magnus TaxID=698827 RepID=UPI000696B131|nr:stealth family protein [Desulfonatronovibrio magnus]
MPHSSKNSPIDAVITWVDGSDPVHRAKRIAALNEKPGKGDIPIAAGRDDTRFQDNGELRYCLASIKKFAPWIRNIFIITDNQVPAFLNSQLMQKMNIKIIDHQVIFRGYEWALPTFNSRSIETAIWRIPEIAPQFIYFNDDFLITNQVSPEDFFENGKVVLRGEWKKLVRFNQSRIYFHKTINFMLKKIFGISRTMYLLAHMRGAELAGFTDKYYWSPHVPHPVKTETMQLFFKANQEIFIQNIKYPYRDMNQFRLTSLSNHEEIRMKNAVLKNANESEMISGERDLKRTIVSKINKIKSGHTKFLCLNSMDKINNSLRNEIEIYLWDHLDIKHFLKHSSTR